MPLKKSTIPAEQAEALSGPIIPVENSALRIAKAHAPAYAANFSDAKGRQISRQGLFQAALQSPALMQYAPTLDDYIALVVRTADAGLAYVNL